MSVAGASTGSVLAGRITRPIVARATQVARVTGTAVGPGMPLATSARHARHPPHVASSDQATATR